MGIAVIIVGLIFVLFPRHIWLMNSYSLRIGKGRKARFESDEPTIFSTIIVRGTGIFCLLLGVLLLLDKNL